MSMGEKAEDATLKGTHDVGRAVVSATLTTIIVFAPVVLGARSEITIWLKEVGLTISVTLIFSLLVSLTLIPVLTSHMLKGGKQSVARNALVERWGNFYGRVLNWTAIKHPWITGIPIVGAVLAVTVGLVMVSDFEPEFIGERGLRHEYLQVEYEFSDNVNYTVTEEYVHDIQAILWPLKDEIGFKYMYSWYQDNNAATRLYFDEKSLSQSDLKDYRQQVREVLPEMAGVKFRFDSDEDEDSGIERFGVTVHGEDSEFLATLAEEVKRRIELIPDVTDVTTDIERGTEEVQIHVDPEKAKRFDVTPSDVAQIMGITFRGVRLPRVRTADREIDLWVSLRPEDRKSIENLQALTVNMTDGKDITLGQISNTVVSRGPDRIQRLNQRTAVRVFGNYEGEEFDDVLEEVRATMEATHFPPGYGWNFGSRIQQAEETQAEMGINVLIAILCVYMVMASLFESLLHPLVVMLCLPFAALGVIWLMIGTNTPFNMMAMIGMVILIGIVVNNGIVLIDHINHHRRDGLKIDEAILRGGRERFRPIMMTAATTVLGLIPLAFGENHVGDAKMFPMARALIGGLVSSTALTLILLPVYYQLSERIRIRMTRLFPGLTRLLGRAGRLLPWRRTREIPGVAETP